MNAQQFVRDFRAKDRDPGFLLCRRPEGMTRLGHVVEVLSFSPDIWAYNGIDRLLDIRNYVSHPKWIVEFYGDDRLCLKHKESGIFAIVGSGELTEIMEYSNEISRLSKDFSIEIHEDRLSLLSGIANDAFYYSRERHGNWENRGYVTLDALNAFEHRLQKSLPDAKQIGATALLPVTMSDLMEYWYLGQEPEPRAPSVNNSLTLKRRIRFL